MLIGGLTTITLFSLICVCTAENKAPSNPTPDLAQKVAALEKRIAELEKRVGPSATPAPVTNPVYQASGVAPPAPSNIPPGSVPRSINGTTFYIVPLSKQTSH
jgi:hypothetical protein